MRVLLIAPHCDGADVGEARSTWQWARRLADQCQMTVLTYNKSGCRSVAEQIPCARVVEWNDIPLFGRFERFNSIAKPGYVLFFMRARRWIKSAIRSGERFDVVHQVSPLAMRYPSPAAGFGVPLVVGPIGGSVPTPSGFEREFRGDKWYVRLRVLDHLRFRWDPLLRRSYKSAAVVIGVAPYVQGLLAPCGIRRFEVMAETGLEELPAECPEHVERSAPLRLLFVGRVVRTKGVRYAVRAMAHAKGVPGVRLDIVGDGDDLVFCKEEATRLAVNDRVKFHGQVPRDRVEEFYRAADVFLFPSLREPSGNVVFEAMGHGLPVIAADAGGPGFVVDETSGIKIGLDNPEQFVCGLGEAICKLASDPALVESLGQGARSRMSTMAIWDRKIDWMLDMYNEMAGGESDSPNLA